MAKAQEAVRRAIEEAHFGFSPGPFPEPALSRPTIELVEGVDFEVVS